ncbi:MAG: hypothetical protein NVSMB29_00570 [Candidatus Dormibacteria bacterium]
MTICGITNVGAGVVATLVVRTVSDGLRTQAGPGFPWGQTGFPLQRTDSAPRVGAPVSVDLPVMPARTLDAIAML